MRVRTIKNHYTTISNSTLHDGHLSFEAIGLLAYCLSMHEDWNFYPKQIASKNKCGREKCYRIFDELIDNNHCIRIPKRNGNLNQGYDYEIYDDQKKCIERKEQLKNILRSTAFRDPETADPEKPYTTKKNGTKKDSNKNGITVRHCENVDNSPCQRKAAAPKKDRPLTQATPTVLAANLERTGIFDPYTYRLRNGKSLDLRTARSFAKYQGIEKEKLLRNILWYERQIDQGVHPKKSHEQMLQWAIKNDMAGKNSYVFQNELYARLLAAESIIPGLEILKTVVRIPLNNNNYESVSLDLPNTTFSEVLKKYIARQ